ncbi:unnamed protein product [Urochloa humidicola]
MDKSGYRNPFTQESSSDAGDGFAMPAPSYLDDFAGYNTYPRSDLQNLDLNATGESYTELLQSGSGMGRSARPTFLPPRQNLFGGGSGHGGRGGAFSVGMESAQELPPRGRGARRAGGGPRGRRLTPTGSTPSRRHPRLCPMNPDPEEEDAGENFDDSSSNGQKYDKANWTVEHNTFVFCQLALEQYRLGNVPKLQMKSYAVQVIAEKFREEIGLWLQHKQFRNRFNQCKTMYNWLKKHRKDTGQGVNANGGIEGHDEEWWKLNCQGKESECKKFRYGMPPYVPFLYEMFDGTQVDGSTSCVPGDWNQRTPAAADEDEDDEDEDDIFKSPQTIDSRKRTASTTDTASSPNSKKSKSPMVNSLDNLIQTMKVGSSREVEVAKEIQQHIVQMKKENKLQEEQRRKAEIAKCLDIVRACGVEEDTDEFYVTGILFKEEDNRTVFLQYTTAAGRVGWLKIEASVTLVADLCNYAVVCELFEL